jgi:hypothetical protein
MKSVGRTFVCQKQSTITGERGSWRTVSETGAVAVRADDGAPAAAASEAAKQSVTTVLSA